MGKSAEIDDPSQLTAAGIATPARRKNGPLDAFGVPPLVKYKRRPELTEELRRWYALDAAGRDDVIKRAIGHEKRWSIETFVHAARQAWATGDQRSYLRTFTALSSRATPLLMSQARKQNAGEDEDHAQNVLEKLAKEIQAGKGEYAEANFADYGLKKAISAFRHEGTLFENSFALAEPVKAEGEGKGDGVDPLDEAADKILSPEARTLLELSVGKLEGELRNVFIQKHMHGMTNKEIAALYGVDESTIRYRVKQANRIVGYQGGIDGDED